MFLSLKKRAFLLCIYSYASVVNSDKAANIANTLTTGLAGGLAGGLTGGLTSGLAGSLTGGLVGASSQADSTRALLGAVTGGSPNMHTCESAGCSSYKDIIKNTSDGCLHGFICKNCKKTHAKNPNICFHSSLDGYENLYEALLEDYIPTSYDTFKIPIDKSSKKEKAHELEESRRGVEDGGDEKGEKSDEHDRGRKGGTSETGAGGRAKGNTGDTDEEDEEGDTDEEEDDEGSSSKFGKTKESNGKNARKDEDEESFLEKSSGRIHNAQLLKQLTDAEKRHMYNEDPCKKKKTPMCHNRYTSLGPLIQRKIGDGHNAYSFLDEQKEKILYKRLKVNINKYEEYLKNKLNKCDIAEDGFATIYVKLLLQIVRDKHDIYTDVSRQSILNTKQGTPKGDRGDKEREDEENLSDNDEEEYGRKSKNGNKENDDDDSNDDDESDSDDEYSNSGKNRYGGGKSYAKNSTLDRYAYIQLQTQGVSSSMRRKSSPALGDNFLGRRTHGNYSSLVIPPSLNTLPFGNTEKYTFYQQRLRDDLDGDSMGNYYKSKNGFFKSLFNKVFRKKSDEEDGEEEEPREKKKRKWVLPWKRRKGKKKSSSKETDSDEEDEDSEDESYRGGKNQSRRDDDDNDNDSSDGSGDDSDEESESGSSFIYSRERGRKKGKRNKRKNGEKEEKGEKYSNTKTKIKSFLSKVKKRVIPEKQKLHIEAFFNNIIVKMCKNSLKWEGNMFKKQSLVEMTLKVPVKMKYIRDKPLNFIRSSYEVILTCRNCKEILFNSCVQVYCTKKKSMEGRKTGDSGNSGNSGNSMNSMNSDIGSETPTGEGLQEGRDTSTANAVTASANLYALGTSDFAPLPMYDNNSYFPGNINLSSSYYNNSSKGSYISYVVLLGAFVSALLL
ncbi:conserved Plasmodium protein, unknown function [Plasmodium ovale]|uniref:Surface-related antigen SRA n=1 Tax=Plasmodium ovale TaxID=36330 RepID=A0A1C3KX20_PLAOA|nr:conserved Plasmodium protein, unknown function [Plasmodium ovale]